MLKNFTMKEIVLKLKRIVILSRISRSKNIDETLNNFVKVDNFINYSIDVVGGTLNEDDKKYLEFLSYK